MSDYDYKELLKKARMQLPKETLKRERFEIPVVKSIIIGKKTEVVNLSELADKIRREPPHILKYLTKELATQGEIQDTKAVFNGNFGSSLINSKFQKYVEEFVLCKECKKPDTKILKDGAQQFLKCEACGARRPIQRLT